MVQGEMADFVKRELRSGEGCVSFENPWRREVRRRTPEEADAVGKKK
jgi:peptide deformylase